jgi:flagellar hook-associated protein 3 FlgL
MSANFYPATTNRVSNAQSLSRLLYQVHADGGTIQQLQGQLSTGRRVLRPSEDPAAAIRAMAAQRGQEFKQQVLSNIDSANTILAASETSLAQVQNLLNEARAIAVESAGNTLSAGERTANAVQIRETLSKLVELGNSRFRDQFLFAGGRVVDRPFGGGAGSVHFGGSDDSLHTVSDYHALFAANITAQEAFGVRSEHLTGSVDLRPALVPTQRLAEINGGDGFRGGAILLRDSNHSVEIDLAAAHTLEDVVRAIESRHLGGRELSVSITGNALRVEYTDGLGGLLTIADVGAGQAAKSLGIVTDTMVSTSPVTGTDLSPQLTRLTLLSSLFDGAGLPSGAEFTLRQNGRDFTISTTGLHTVEDLLNRIEQSGARVKATLDGRTNTLSVQSLESGTALSIGEAGGNLASLLGLRSMDLSTPVSQLNFGTGIYGHAGTPDLLITRTDGSPLAIDLDGVQTIEDVLERINNHLDNTDPALRVTASLAATGNGIELRAAAGGQALSITNHGGSQAARGLGFLPPGATLRTGVTVGGESVITGDDVSGVEVEGAFTTLIRLAQAIESSDTGAMERLVSRLDSDLQRVASSRAVVGARQRSAEDLAARTEEQRIQLKAEESKEIEADLASVISELAGRQAAYQASLQLMGRLTQISLFNFL